MSDDMEGGPPPEGTGATPDPGWPGRSPRGKVIAAVIAVIAVMFLGVAIAVTLGDEGEEDGQAPEATGGGVSMTAATTTTALLTTVTCGDLTIDGDGLRQPEPAG